MTINYRLGVFGNLTYPGLKDGGTFGLLDQLAALKWARANARAFGGDPHNVAKDAQAFATQGAAALDCTDAATAVDCLRGKEVEKLLGLEVPFNAPSYDNSLLPRDPAVALRAGRFQRMPLLSGGNRDEANGSAAAIEAAGHLTEDAYQDLLADSFGADAPRVAARYPASAYQSPAAAWGAVATDRAWACPTLEGNRLLAKRARTYGYEFADRTAPPIVPAPPGFPTGASHAFDLPYVQSLDHDPARADMAERHRCDLWSTIP